MFTYPAKLICGITRDAVVRRISERQWYIINGGVLIATAATLAAISAAKEFTDASA